MRVIMGPESSMLRNLSEKMELPYVPIEFRTFPDGEVCPRIPQIDGYSHVYIFNRLDYATFYPNRHLMEYYFLDRALEDMGIERRDMIMPYLPYGRQDKMFRLGEPFSLRYILELFASSGVSRIYTLMAHIPRLSGIVENKNMRVVNINVRDKLTEYISSIRSSNPFIIGPDGESRRWVEDISSKMGVDYAVLDKRRDFSTDDVRTTGDIPSLNGKDVYIVDDILSTGKTVENAIRMVQEKNPASINVVAVHGIFSNGAIDMLSKYDISLVTSNTIKNPFSSLKMEDIISRAIKKW